MGNLQKKKRLKAINRLSLTSKKAQLLKGGRSVKIVITNNTLLKEQATCHANF